MHFVLKQSSTQRKVTQRSRFTRKLPVVAAATVLPKFIFYLNSGPLLIVLPDLIIKLLNLLGVSSFRLTLKLDFSWSIYALFSFGLSRGCLVYWSKKRKSLFLRVAFSEKERT